MRVCHVITGLGDGGAEAVLFRLCTAVADVKDGIPHTHHVISLSGPGRYGSMLAAQGVRVDCLDMPRGQLTLAGLLKLFRLLRRERPDIVQTWMYHANLVGGVMGRLLGIRNVVWGLHHNFLDSASASRTTRLVNWCCARLSHVVPRSIVSCSQQGAVTHAALGYAASKFAVIPNGYDLSQFSTDDRARATLRSEWRVAPDTFLIGMVARWHPVKDHPNLLAALTKLVANRISPWRCVLIGTGTGADNIQLRDRIAELHLDGQIVMLGHRGDIAATMNALDLHALASYSEGFPNVVAEAMACGTPCVVTDVGDASYIVDDTGWVVPPRMPEALANAIAAAMEAARDNTAWANRRVACRARVVEEFSLSRMVSSYQRVWHEIQGDQA
ncbi:MAG: glycosyl transferase family 1 [Devosia sp.]|nr:glycosyl transferase family 1 [Devosia sp.]